MASQSNVAASETAAVDPQPLGKLLVAVVQLRAKGRTREQIIAEFTGNGASLATAELLADQGIAIYRVNRRKSGYNQMMMGIVTTIIGILVTVIASHIASTSITGGSYIVAIGALVVGPIAFVRGLWRLCVG